ncbi:MAG: TOBE domain-containing protein [Rhodospirillales bacterium]|jgi:molybdopterin-binding protein|nr:TOBE domain-containing protein [Rhodospirillales bacterium]
MKISARNALKGTVIDVNAGPIMASVKVDIGGGHVVTAIVTAESVKELAMAPGAKVYAVVKATEVMLATDDD